MRLARKRIGGLSAVALAVAGGAAFVTVGGVLAETGLRSHLPAERTAGADVVVAAPQTLDQPDDLDAALPERAQLPGRLVDRLGGLAEASAAVGEVSFPAAVVSGGGTASGPDPRTAGRAWSAAELPGGDVAGAAPQGTGEVALDAAAARSAGVGVGDELRVTAAGRTGDYRLSAIVADAGSGVFFADTVAAEFDARADGAGRAGPAGGPPAAGVDLIALRSAPGTSAEELAEAVRGDVEASGSDAVVYAGDARGDAEAPAASAGRATLLAIAGSLSGTVLLIVGFAVAGAVSVSVAAQRRDLALLRIVGATPRRIRRLVAVPDLFSAAVALLPGIAAGYLLAAWLHELLAGVGVVPAGLPVAVGPLPAVAAAVLLLGTVWLASVAASAPVSAAPPIGALAESAAQPRPPRPWRARAGAALMAASAVLSVPPLLVDSRMGMVGTATASLVAVIGLALAGPALVRALTGAAARRLPARASALTWLAVRNLHGHAYRVAGAAASLAMAVAFTLGYAYAHTTPVAAADMQRSESTLAQHRVSAPGIGGVPDEAASAVRDAPGVAAAVASIPTSVAWPYQALGEDTRSFDVLPADALGPGAAAVVDPGVVDGDLDRLSGSAIAVGASYADRRGVEVGDTPAFRLGDGTRVRARVAALYERELAFGPVLLSRDLVAGHVTGGLPTALLVRTRDGEEAAAAGALESVAAEHPGVEVAAAAGSAESGGETSALPADTVLNFVVLSALLGYMLMAVANRLAAQTLQRGAEVSALRSVGMTPGQVRSVLRRESLMLAAGAVAAGVVAVAVPLALVGIGYLGRPWPGGPVWLLPASAAVVALLAWLSVEFPARRLVAAAARREE
ncbi:hypothetical protein LP52_06125 [Streptomonospora alba]|uniref:ABC3 transporter permease C-terminal domain-containing protein n=1 Tax=Streptomonospora alba TaxID=183763 RepID=A0A0C2JEQ3_9ACTN|nr:hypothetical protein LP52_06125 [Streptomonospora alba]